jgi:hypothetical protein
MVLSAMGGKSWMTKKRAALSAATWEAVALRIETEVAYEL